MKQHSMVNLITNSSTSIYSYADVSVGQKLLDFMNIDGTALEYPDALSYDYAAIRGEDYSEEEAPVHTYCIQNSLYRYGNYSSRYGVNETEQNQEAFEDTTSKYYPRCVISVDEMKKKTGLTASELVEKYPDVYYEYGEIMSIDEMLEDGMLVEAIVEHMNTLISLVEEQSGSYNPRPSTTLIFIIDGKVNKELQSIAYGLYDHDAQYEG